MKKVSIYKPTTVGEAIQILSQHGTSAAVYAGGTDLLVQLRRFDFRQHLASLRSVSNVSVTPAQIAVSAGIDRRVDECLDVAGEQQVRLSGGALHPSCIHNRQA